MEEMKHTPGPWRIGTAPPNGEQAIGTIRGMMVAVATTGVGMEKETLANARLIAAAPELLNALQGMLRDHKAVHGVGDLEMQPALFQAHAAIDKATGRFGMTTQPTPMEGRATGLLQAVRSIAAITTCADQDPEAMCAEIQGICRVALAKVTGGAA